MPLLWASRKGASGHPLFVPYLARPCNSLKYHILRRGMAIRKTVYPDGVDAEGSSHQSSF